jgi:hypothetical protein
MMLCLARIGVIRSKRFPNGVDLGF